jgi:hypothetical protein
VNGTFGQTVITTHYDPDILNGYRPYNWATSVVVQHEILPGMAANVGYYRTSWYNFTANDNRLVTPADYDPYCLALPQDSRLPGGGGNTLCGLYNIKPEKFSASGNNVITKASTYGTQTDIYNGIDVTIAARLRGGTFVQGGMNTGRQETDSCGIIDSPSGTVATNVGAGTYQNNPTGYCHVVPPFWRPEFKFSGSHRLPYGVQLSGVVQSIPGIPISASYVATNAEVRGSLNRNLSGSATTVTINNVIPPQTLFEKNRLKQVDLRMIRNFNFARTRLQAMFDIYNLFNAAAMLSEITTYGATWQKPTAILDARIFKVGMQMNF